MSMHACWRQGNICPCESSDSFALQEHLERSQRLQGRWALVVAAVSVVVLPGPRRTRSGSNQVFRSCITGAGPRLVTIGGPRSQKRCFHTPSKQPKLWRLRAAAQEASAWAAEKARPNRPRSALQLVNSGCRRQQIMRADELLLALLPVRPSSVLAAASNLAASAYTASASAPAASVPPAANAPSVKIMVSTTKHEITRSSSSSGWQRARVVGREWVSEAPSGAS